MNVIDLTKEYSIFRRSEFEIKVKEIDSYTEIHPKFKLGDVIEFYGGFNNHILYRSKIIGFDVDGGIYVSWDCYWVPIYDDDRRKIKLVK